ncbi:alpha/beta fold hydrolase [Alkalihalobacillus sp. BA299]|uniref:alpha/beta fold hydrolase n=1 Tax=Alkalihalobacillus sp. BA299 TaxID=2815938 RepID=UPI001ADBFD19|nr:alpha/beta hydrolase [Alkalihalobacillus sp. BA299]
MLNLVSVQKRLHHKIFPHKKSLDLPWVVLLHGLGGNSKIWYKQLKYFKKNFNVMTIDLPDHHPNPVFKEWEEQCSFKTCANMIVNVLDEHKIRKAHFVGISLGSVVIYQLMKSHENRIHSAVLGGMVIRFNRFSETLIRVGSAVKNFVPYMWLYRLFAQIMMPKRNHKASRNIFIGEAKKMGRTSFLRWFQLANSVRETTNGDHIKVPKLYISGNEDHLFVELVKDHLKGDKHGKLHVIPNCGHVCNIEKSDEFNEISSSFINSIEEISRLERAK